MAHERRGQEGLIRVLGAPPSAVNTRTTLRQKDRHSDKESVKYRNGGKAEIIRQRENDLYERQNS